MELRARIIEGTDVWYDRYLQKNGKYVFHKTNNSVVALHASCDQKGFDALYAIGKQLWDAGMCSKFEIAAFDGSYGTWGQMFWKHRPDQYNFERNRYGGRFDQMIREEFQAYSSPDFQNDPMELKHLQEIQNRFWDKLTVTYTPAFFQDTIQNTILFENLEAVQAWLDGNGMAPSEDLPGFDHNGTWITNPFYEETGRFSVEPLSYYGIQKVTEYISLAKKQLSAEKNKHTPLDERISEINAHRSKDLFTNNSMKPIHQDEPDRYK